MEEKIKLITDYHDFYDHHFDMEGIPWKRLARNSLNRGRAFKLLQSFGLKTPPFGTTEELAESVPYDMLLEVGDNCDVVVYLDEYAHCGEGKVKMNIFEAYETYPGNLCSLYMTQSTFLPESYRFLKIGHFFVWLHYTSDDFWRSNCGNVEIDYPGLKASTVLFENPIFTQLVEKLNSFPLVAIDFVQSEADMLWAVDLNTAPGLKDTPLEDDLGGELIASFIKEHLYEHKVGKVA